MTNPLPAKHAFRVRRRKVEWMPEKWHGDPDAEPLVWIQVRWECSCGAGGRWGKQNGLRKKWMQHMMRAESSE